MSFYELHQETVPLRKAVAEWLELPFLPSEKPAVVGHYENPLRIEVRSCSLYQQFYHVDVLVYHHIVFVN